MRYLLFCIVLLPAAAWAQQIEKTRPLDTISKQALPEVLLDTTLDTTLKQALPAAEKKRKKRKGWEDMLPQIKSAKKAALLSAVLPGAGQVYNRAYWKVPIVWAFLAYSGYFLVDNVVWYRRAGDAYEAKQLADRGDVSMVDKIDPRLRPLSTASVRNYRDQFRSDIDFYSLLTFVFWGLNVVEAAVHAHLLGFDVTPKLSMRVTPMLQSFGTHYQPGLGVSLYPRTYKKRVPSILF